MKLVALCALVSIAIAGCKKDDAKPAAGSAAGSAGSAAAPGSAGSSLTGSAAVTGSAAAAGSDAGSAGAAGAAGSGSAGSAADAGSAGSGAAAATGSSAALPTVAGDEQGFLLADTPKGTVALEVGKGKQEQLPDGTIVQIIDWPDDVERPDHGEQRYVSANGKRGAVLSRQVVQADHIVRAPKGDFAVLTPFDSSGDLEHSAIWLVRGMAERWRVFETAVDPDIAWHPQGTAIAIGGDGELAVYELPSGKQLHKVDKYYAPSYAPDGTLYVRASDWGVYTFTDGKAKRVGKGKVKRKDPDEDFGPSPQPVSFDAKGKYVLED